MRSRPGWHEEGIAFCVLSTQRLPLATAVLPQYAPPNVKQGDCPTTAGYPPVCIESGQLSSLSALRGPLPADQVAQYQVHTGTTGEIVLAPTYTDDSTAPVHSFVQFGRTPWPMGFFLTTVDRIGYGEIASLTARTPVMSPDGDALKKPFVDAYEVPMDVLLTARYFVKEVMAYGASEVYVQPRIAFVDTVSGHRLVLAPGSIGTNSPADTAVLDAATGNAVVTLALGITAIGRSSGLPSLVTPKMFAADNPWGWGGDFVYRINRDEFERAIALARALDPVLGTDPRQYGIESVGVAGEVTGQSEIGYNVEKLAISLVRP
jgi:hypothetical protein